MFDNLLWDPFLRMLSIETLLWDTFPSVIDSEIALPWDRIRWVELLEKVFQVVSFGMMVPAL